MSFRCLDCGAGCRVERTADPYEDRVTCTGCGRTFTESWSREFGARFEEQRQQRQKEESVSKTNGKADAEAPEPEQKTETKVIHSQTKSLPVRLTEQELLQKSAELASTVQDYATEESRQVDIKAQLKAKLTELDARRTQLASVVARREEYRDVRCEIVANTKTLLAQIVRTDTGEVIQTRPLTMEERQMVLPLAPHAKATEIARPTDIKPN